LFIQYNKETKNFRNKMKTEYKTPVYSRRANKAFYERNKETLNEGAKAYYHEHKTAILEKKKENYRRKKQMKDANSSSDEE